MEYTYLDIAKKLSMYHPKASRRMIIILAKNSNRKRKKPTEMGI